MSPSAATLYSIWYFTQFFLERHFKTEETYSPSPVLLPVLRLAPMPAAISARWAFPGAAGAVLVHVDVSHVPPENLVAVQIVRPGTGQIVRLQRSLDIFGVGQIRLFAHVFQLGGKHRNGDGHVSTAMIAMTISISIRVKPPRALLVCARIRSTASLSRRVLYRAENFHFLF
jgi:hypothetical protein